jgi:hypothetical protein
MALVKTKTLFSSTLDVLRIAIRTITAISSIPITWGTTVNNGVVWSGACFLTA